MESSVKLPRGELNMRGRDSRRGRIAEGGPEGGRWGEAGTGRRTCLIAGPYREGSPRRSGESSGRRPYAAKSRRTMGDRQAKRGKDSIREHSAPL